MRHAEPPPRGLGEMRGKQRDVLAPLAQRRHVDREHGEAVEEIGPEAPLGDGGAQVAVGGGDHAHVDAVRLVRAHALDLALLQRAQQHRLQLQRQVADLVEEERAAVGDLELAGAVARGAGEGAGDVAEELARGDRLGQRRAVDLDQRLGAAQRLVVQVPRDQFLADAGLAGDEHREVRRRDDGQFLEQALHGLAGAEDLLARGLARRALQVAGHQFALGGGRLERLDQGRRAHRGAGEGGEGGQQLQVHAVEGAGVERVRGEGADDAVAVEQRAAEAGVDIGEFAVLAREHAVEGVGQRTVGGEVQRVARAQDGVEPRVLAARVALHDGLGREPHGRQRHQRLALEPQQARRVVGDEPAHRREQPLVPVGGGEGRREVAGDVQEGGQRGRGHCYLL